VSCGALRSSPAHAQLGEGPSRRPWSFRAAESPAIPTRIGPRRSGVAAPLISTAALFVGRFFLASGNAPCVLTNSISGERAFGDVGRNRTGPPLPMEKRGPSRFDLALTPDCYPAGTNAQRAYVLWVESGRSPSPVLHLTVRVDDIEANLKLVAARRRLKLSQSGTWCECDLCDCSSL